MGRTRLYPRATSSLSCPVCVKWEYPHIIIVWGVDGALDVICHSGFAGTTTNFLFFLAVSSPVTALKRIELPRVRYIQSILCGRTSHLGLLDTRPISKSVLDLTRGGRPLNAYFEFKLRAISAELITTRCDMAGLAAIRVFLGLDC